MSDSNYSVRIPRKKKERTGILLSNKGPQKKAHTHHGTQHYCALFKKSGMPEQNYRSHSAEDCMGMRANWTIKDGMGG